MKRFWLLCLVPLISFALGALLANRKHEYPPSDYPCLVSVPARTVTELRIGIQELHISAQGLRIHSGPDRATAYVPSEGYALADLTDPARPALYPLSPGGCYDIAGRTALIELDPDRRDGLIVNIF